MTDRIGLNRIVLFGHHGVHEYERRLGQRFVVDIEMAMDLSTAGASDRLEDTVNYSDAYRIVKAVIEGPSRNLLEALAEEIARSLLRELGVDEARVRIGKPGVPAPGAIDQAWVEVLRRRDP
jgi:dihydroneopterin aldolase